MKTQEQRLQQAFEHLRNEPTSFTIDRVSAMLESGVPAGTSQGKPTDAPTKPKLNRRTLMTISALSVVGMLTYLALSSLEGNPATTANNQLSTHRPAAAVQQAPISQQAPRIAGNSAAVRPKVAVQTAHLANSESASANSTEEIKPLPVELKGSYLHLANDVLQRLGIEVKDKSIITCSRDGASADFMEIYLQGGVSFQHKKIDEISDIAISQLSPAIVTTLAGVIRTYTNSSESTTDSQLPEGVGELLEHFGKEAKEDGKRLMVSYPLLTNPNATAKERVVLRDNLNDALVVDVYLTREENDRMSEKSNKQVREDFVLNNYIGVKVVLGNSGGNEEGFILWYKPEEGFLTKLPDLSREQIEQELGLKPQSAVTGCRYTQQCLTSSGAILGTSVVPDKSLAKGITVNFDLAEDRNLSFALYTLNGHKVDLQKNIPVAKGKGQYSMDFGTSPSGLYLMVITSDKGERAVQRIILEDRK